MERNLEKFLERPNFPDPEVIFLTSGHATSVPTLQEDQLTELLKRGSNIRMAYNRLKVNQQYNRVVTNSVQRRAGGWQRVLVCTSTSAADLNLYKFADAFIMSNECPFPKGMKNSSHNNRDIDSLQLLQTADRALSCVRDLSLRI
jgi:hypothetical protein